MAESLESQIIKKLNKIVNQYELEIKTERNDVRDTFIKLQHRTFTWNYIIWPDLHTFLFPSDKFYSLAQWAQLSEVDLSSLHNLQQQILQSGLLSALSDVSSLEEILLRLNVMFPDV